MISILPQPIFADGGSVVALLVLIFTVVGWLVNLANSQNNPQAPPANRPPRPPQPPRDKLQNEIDIFLKEVRGQAPAKQDDEILVEVISPGRPQQRPRTSPPPPPPRQPEPPRPATRGRLATVAPQVESHVGETLASHHLETHVGEAIPAKPTSAPQTGGEMVALQPLGSSGAKSTAPVMSLFKDRNSIKQAILVNEILGKPKSLRDS